MATWLNPQQARIFRIVHVDCLPWILDRGVHCRSSPQQDPAYINIGSPGLIQKRASKPVPIAPGGTLSDYVPFYFTPWSIMMFNIHTGYSGIPKRENRDIAILVSSMHRIQELQLPFVFTDQHAYAIGTDFFASLAELNRIDWPLLQSRNFKTDDEDPGKQVRYQAEALVHRHVPLAAVLGIGCFDEPAQRKIESLIAARGLDLKVKPTPSWYFQ